MTGGEARLGRGATLTLAGVARLNPIDAEGSLYWLRLTEDSRAGLVVDGLLDELGAVPTNDDPYFDNSFFDELIGVSQLEQVDGVPRVFAAVMGLMALGVTIHLLVDALRANGRNLAVLRALGFRRGDVSRAVATQSIVYASVALAIGVPLGVVAGRAAWRLYAQQLGVVPEPVVPWPALSLLAAAALALAAVLGFALGRRTASISPATALRTE